MSVVIETTLGDITVDLFVTERTNVCRNFLKLCKIKYYNYNLFHTVNRGFIAQTGDPTGSRSGGESVFSAIGEKEKRYFKPEQVPRIKHSRLGLISFVGDGDGMVGSQFFITLGSELYYLDESHCVFGEVVEGQDVLDIFNSDVICDSDHRPYKDVRITHTVVLDDPFPDPEGLQRDVRSPSPSAERLQGGRIGADEDVDETQGKNVGELQEIVQEREAKARATILEMVGDIPDADMAPPENVLFVCKLNPVTTDDDLEIIFSRFGKIRGCEVIRDRRSGDSLQYAFVEFEEEKACVEAYFKMDNVLIDDRRVHVDFSQSVAKVRWMGKGKGLRGGDKSLGQGKYERIDKNIKSIDHKDSNYDKKRDKKEGNDDHDRKREDKYERKDRSYERSHLERKNRSPVRDMDNARRERKYDKYDERNKNKWQRENSRYEKRRDEKNGDRYCKGSNYEERRYREKERSVERKSRRDIMSGSREDHSHRRDSYGSHRRNKDSRRSKSRSRDKSKDRKTSKPSKNDSKSEERKYKHESSSSDEDIRHEQSSSKL